MPLHDPDPKQANLFENVEFVVEATDEERFLLWCVHFDNPNPKYPESRIKSWEQEMRGFGREIGTFHGHPIFISITYAKLEGKRVAFLEATSRIVDYSLVNDWVDREFKNRMPARVTNSTNFSHCISFLRRT